MAVNFNKEKLDDAYRKYWAVHSEMLDRGLGPLEIAGLLASQSLTLYRTILTEEEYNKMVDAISENRDKVKTINLSGPSIL